jgi:hypothetical protein
MCTGIETYETFGGRRKGIQQLNQATFCCSTFKRVSYAMETIKSRHIASD